MSEQVRDCTFCGAFEHLYINRTKGVYYCFKCNAGGRVKDLDMPNVSLTFGEVEKTLTRKIADPKFHLTLPPKEISWTLRGADYLNKRIPKAVNKNLYIKVYQSELGLVFLYPDESYWQERRWMGKPRWVNPTDAPLTPATGVTYHQQWRSIKGADTVVLVEGVFDCIAATGAGFNAAAHLSQKIHPKQIERLEGRGYQHFIYIPDYDVPTNVIADNILLLGMYGTVDMRTLPGSGSFRGPKDLSEMFEKDGLEAVKKFLTYEVKRDRVPLMTKAEDDPDGPIDDLE